MTLGLRLRESRKRAGFTQKQLADMIGAKHNSVSNWEKGLNHPDTATIESICKILKITPNYLLIGDEYGTSVLTDGDFSIAETELLQKYRGLDSTSRGAVDLLIDYYCGIAGNVNSPASGGIRVPYVAANVYPACDFTVIEGKISTQSVAAGTGTYLGSDAFETISVRKNSLTEKADFYVPVSGDSMEPRFYDGDILIIQRLPVNRGEIGIFTLDGQGFVKVCGKSELISLNSSYEPIPMNDDIICNGKVIGVLEPGWLVD